MILIPLSWQILGGLAITASAFGAGWLGHVKYRQGVDARHALEVSEQARKADHDSAVSKIRALDSYSVSAARNAARALPARDDLRSVQHSAATLASASSPAACQSDDRLSRVLGLLAECAGLVETGARVVDDLRAKRDALSEAKESHP